MYLTWRTITIGMILVLFLYGAVAFAVRTSRQRAFDTTVIGATSESVIERFGAPFVRERPDRPFGRYATSNCAPPCTERLWFENRLALDLEAWSVSIGSDGRVIDKYHWVSP